MGKIIVENIGKAYKQYDSRWSRFAEWFIPYASTKHSLKWVLRDISFATEPGEALGIIGINGAGKSTLLKMITGTTRATTGHIYLEGRVAAMLELGMGFHPDFTGRQNVIMSGQLLGYSVEEIYRIMPEIEAFAEIGAYIDQPVRVYSSGMQMRLAFSVATAVRPDILIVDEALSVGDAYFQHKSFNRIREFNRKGTTLLIVSHDKQAIQSICNKAILINNGRLEMSGAPEAVMDYYNALLADKQNKKIEQLESDDGTISTLSGSGEASVSEIKIINSKGQRAEFINVGEDVTLRITVTANENIPRLVLGYGIKDRLGQVLYGTNTDLKNKPIENVKKGDVYQFDIRFAANLGPGSYSIQTALVSTETHLVNNYEWRDLAMLFNIINVDKTYFSGCAWIDPAIEITPLCQ